MEEFYYTQKLFGDKMDIALYGPQNFSKKKLDKIVSEVFNEALRLQKIFNFYDPNSELSKLNKKRKLNVSNELLEVLKKSLEYAVLTKGAYDLSIGKAILARKIKGQTIESHCSYKDIYLVENNVSLMHGEVLIDLGSIAKGYIGDRVVNLLKEKGILSGMVDARGDIRVFGDYTFKLEIQHPRIKDQAICSVLLKDCAIATSGDYNQYIGDYSNSHILNKKHNISVTVIAPTLFEADVLTSAIFVLEGQELKRLLNSSSYPTLLISQNLNKNFVNAFKNFLVK